MKHGVIISDSHCGHKFGFVPPEWWGQEGDDHEKEKVREWQETTYRWIERKAKGIGHIDRLICNGDMVDGNGEKSGGTELITTDRLEQSKMALHLIRLFDADNYTLIEGTNYHTGAAERFEEPIADALGVRLQAHAWIEHAGCVIDFKHHIGSTSTPGAIPPALPRERVWNLLWAEHQLQPKARVFIRSHLHKYYIAGDETFLGIVTPPLQGWTRYGGLRMSKTISYGFIEFWISDKGEFTWKTHLLIPVFQAAKAESM